MEVDGKPECRFILGTRVDGMSYKDVTRQILQWAAEKKARSVYCADAHMLMRAYDSNSFRTTINAADVVTSDGTPITWLLRWGGLTGQERVAGPDLMLRVCKAAADRGIPIGLYGSTEGIQADLRSNLKRAFPALQIKYSNAPPFRPLNEIEDASVVTNIKDSDAQILFVALGCPKQEIWIHEHKDCLPLVMLGVGWAFAVHAGHSSRAPEWMQNAGLESLHQIIIEPGRYLTRYLSFVPRFIFIVLRSVLTRHPGVPGKTGT